ncbi:hypothetical protein [Algoriphagus pacificus]|uniref:Uncharacterized protein n=1 Tax=Algoriphagus pacificus TaxID=2811234 RepID=A0ABS3CA46_9BACT|nr:hypothetical protein [Algoriphagus pacificus]MBN7813983.1 hypothetical protein [Algoriphagus pacificus]
MKFPSVFRTASPMRFDIKPRYYDPIKEEIDQRTSRIKQELKAEGLLTSEELDGDKRFQSGIRGAFAQHRGIKERSSNPFTSVAMIRSFIFFILLGGLGGYIYLGPVIFEYILYFTGIVAGIYFFFRLKPKSKDE